MSNRSLELGKPVKFRHGHYLDAAAAAAAAAAATVATVMPGTVRPRVA